LETRFQRASDIFRVHEWLAGGGLVELNFVFLLVFSQEFLDKRRAFVFVCLLAFLEFMLKSR
jgi:hypothetical protein